MFVPAWLMLSIRMRSINDWPDFSSPTLSAEHLPLNSPSNPAEWPNLGRILTRSGNEMATPPSPDQRLTSRLWSILQNPVAWILILILAALLYTLLGN